VAPAMTTRATSVTPEARLIRDLTALERNAPVGER
jgi:hypothetical protein